MLLKTSSEASMQTQSEVPLRPAASGDPFSAPEPIGIIVGRSDTAVSSLFCMFPDSISTLGDINALCSRASCRFCQEDKHLQALLPRLCFTCLRSLRAVTFLARISWLLSLHVLLLLPLLAAATGAAEPWPLRPKPDLRATRFSMPQVPVMQRDPCLSRLRTTNPPNLLP